MKVRFLLNGDEASIDIDDPTLTLLDWLREKRSLCGTKEGCNEGDCGACTVTVMDDNGAKALNACILFLPQLHGKSVWTVEGLDGAHPVQKSMIEQHGSQCGFCTPGIVNSLVAAQLRRDENHDEVLAGNLCRCTGYAPIIRAAKDSFHKDLPERLLNDQGLEVDQEPYAPETLDALCHWYAENPDATLIAGATDVGLWVTKGLQNLEKVMFLGRCQELRQIDIGTETIRFGATVTMDSVLETMRIFHPSYAEMLRRYGSTQVRASATIGGNIANGSPIGDNPPPLIALGATLHLRRGTKSRDIAIEDFFVSYGNQDRKDGEIVTGVTIPKTAPDLRVYKLSKRFDQDISAVCGAFNITRKNGVVSSARIAFGGMAGTPKRATAAEAALVGKEWSGATIAASMAAMKQDYEPLSDARAGADYRMKSAQNMLMRYFLDSTGVQTNVLEVEA